ISYFFYGIDAGVGAFNGVGAGQDQRATSCRRCGFLSTKCKKEDENSMMYFQTLSQAVNEFKNKRGSRAFYQRMFGIHLLHRPREGKNPFVDAIQNL
ncbi:hypothetical protein EJD97_010028, partial [Solanum chilense]